MKRILIFSHALELGGAEKALIGLLESVSTLDVDVDLFLMRHEGELLNSIPVGINLLPERTEYTCLATPVKKVIKKRQYNMMLSRILGKIRARIRVKELNLPKDNDVALQLSHKCALPFVPRISDVHYDLAISFLTPHYFVAEKVEADRKIAWIHTDYQYVAIDVEEQLTMWNKFDWIASISESVTDSFLKMFPELASKVRLLPNIMPTCFMEKQAKAFSVEKEMPKESEIILLSIGRFCNAKNFDQIPTICRLILDSNVNVKWYIIGYGHDQAMIEDAILREGMQNNVIILGKKENPYPYIKACDYYVQPSRYEGKCMSVIEAQMLNKPVIITNYSTAKSQLEDGVDGVIVPMDNEGCAKEIVRIITDPELTDMLVRNTEMKDYSNAGMVDDLVKLIS